MPLKQARGEMLEGSDRKNLPAPEAARRRPVVFQDTSCAVRLKTEMVPRSNPLLLCELANRLGGSGPRAPTKDQRLALPNLAK